MSIVSAQVNGPAEPWSCAASGTPPSETTCVLSAPTALQIVYPGGGGPDTIAALAVATVYGGSVTTFDRTAGPWVVFTVQGSSALQLVVESAIGTVSGTIGLLARITRTAIDRLPLGSGGGGGGGGIAAFSFVPKTADYTITTTDTGIAVDASGGAVTITLPTAVGAAQEYTIKRVDATYATNSVTLVPAVGGQTIEFLSAVTLISQGHSVVLGSDGANWLVASSHYADPATHQGSLVAIDANGVPQEVLVGTEDQKLTVNTALSTYVDWE